MPKGFKKETDLAALVVDWMTQDGWDVYQEVLTGQGVADIVGRRGKVTHVVECKLSANFDVIGQAWRQQAAGEYVSVAVPYPKRGGGAWATFCHACKLMGIGVLAVAPEGWGRLRVMEAVPPRWNRPYLKNAIGKHPRKRYRPLLADMLCEEQKTAAMAGTNAGGYHTPFKATCSRVQAFVRDHPGCSPKECIAGVEHHWAKTSAPYTLAAFVGKGIVPGVRVEKIGGRLALFPTDPK
jgi:hypothetical protein